MQSFGQIGKLLTISGIILLGAGLFFLLFGKIPWLGNLPGDIYIRKENFTFYFPLTTCILISIILVLLLFIFRIFKR
ncbi:DUF2905 domain-containing protein [candidate division WOR-3 bacterium]|nr:DUF2905 domain-containing protein [candidate division WOR-3 bacterium]MCK4330425.1 DUF2905 domain-containing protein [candidate division WOR-3 bacterium]